MTDSFEKCRLYVCKNTWSNYECLKFDTHDQYLSWLQKSSSFEFANTTFMPVCNKYFPDQLSLLNMKFIPTIRKY